jgi:predicted ester cyclase
MSKGQNTQKFRRLVEEVLNTGETERLGEFMRPDFVEHQFGLKPRIEGMAQDFQFLHHAFPDYALTIEDILEEGDKVWARMTCRGTNRGGFMGPPNDKSFEITVIDIARFENGKIVEHWGVPDRFAVMAQLGLLPRAEMQEA